MKFAAYMIISFITFCHIFFGSIVYHCIYGCMFCLLLFNLINIIIVMFMYSYCYVRSVLGNAFYCVVLSIVCV